MRWIEVPSLKSLAWRGLAILIACAAAGSQAGADQAVQTDWSGGTIAGPVDSLGSCFSTAVGVSWLAVPGQLALSSDPISPGLEHLINDAYTLSFSIESADMDGDGDVDVIGTSEGSDLVSIWFNQGGEPPVWIEQVVGTLDAADGLCIDDLDRDGDPDVIATGGGIANRIIWFRNDGGAPLVWARELIGRDWRSAFEVSVADVDGDLDTDVVSASWDLATVAWWSNDGGDPVVWTRHVVADDFAGAHSAHGADLDGDGDTDIVATCGQGHEVAWWSNDGGDPISWTKRTIRSDFVGGRSVFPADIDRDGDLDLAGTAWTNEVTWWRNEGGDPIVWQEQVIDANFAGGHSIRIADLNGDGRPDVIAAAFSAGDIIWYGNEGGDPISWSRHVVADDYTGAINARCGDLDGDGDLDVLGTSYTLGEFGWWEVSSFRSPGDLEGSVLDLHGTPGYVSLSWTAGDVPGTAISFRVRSGESADQLGEWSSPLGVPGPLPPLEGRYVQYEAHLETSDPTVSPILTGMELNWSAGAVPEEVGSEADLHLYPLSPARDVARVRFVLPQPGPAELSLFDVNGRRVASLNREDFPAGTNESRIEGLKPGVYLCRLSAAGRESSRRLIVVGP